MILPKISSFAASSILINGSAIDHAWRRRKFSIFQRGLQQDADGRGFSAHLGAWPMRNLEVFMGFRYEPTVPTQKLH